MYRVMDTIELREEWTRLYPELAKCGEGIIAVVDPIQLEVAPAIAGHRVTVTRPDGSTIRAVATCAEAPAGVVGVGLRGIAGQDVPRGSTLEW